MSGDRPMFTGEQLHAALGALSLLHHTAPAPALVADATATADANLTAATSALDQLRAGLRRDGFDL